MYSEVFRLLTHFSFYWMIDLGISFCLIFWFQSTETPNEVCMKWKSYFLNVSYGEQFMHVSFFIIIFDLVIFKHHNPFFRRLADFSLLMYAGLIQSLSLLKPRPFLKIDCSLALRTSSIQSKDRTKTCPTFISFLIIRFTWMYIREEMICCYFRNVVTLMWECHMLGEAIVPTFQYFKLKQ